MPDIEIPELKSNALTKALISNNLVFDYATKYYYSNKVDKLNDFNFSDADFKAFKSHVQASDFNFETKTEKALRQGIEEEDTALLGEEMKKRKVKTHQPQP